MFRDLWPRSKRLGFQRDFEVSNRRRPSGAVGLPEPETIDDGFYRRYSNEHATMSRSSQQTDTHALALNHPTDRNTQLWPKSMRHIEKTPRTFYSRLLSMNNLIQ